MTRGDATFLARNWHSSIHVRDTTDTGDVDPATDLLLRAASQAAIQGEPVRVRRTLVSPGELPRTVWGAKWPNPVWRQVLEGCADLVAAEMAPTLKRREEMGKRQAAPNHVLARRLFAACIVRSRAVHVWEYVPAWCHASEMREDANAAAKYLSEEAREYLPHIRVWADMLAVEYGK